LTGPIARIARLSGVLAAIAGPAWAQTDLARERADFARWLAAGPTSPRAAVARQPIGSGLRLGPPGADIPLEGMAEHRVTARPGGVRLETDAGSRVMRAGVPVQVGRYTLTVGGQPGREVLTVFGARRAGAPPTWYDPSSAFVFVGPLAPPAQGGAVRVLGDDGTEVEAAEAGSVAVPVPGGTVRLRVLRMPMPGGDESELEIFFQDRTNGHGTYPAGRFASLVPVGSGRYRLDFNRARNPFCAYSSAYPCPAPWGGNSMPAAVTAGERYEGGEPSDEP
jgi:uncharacterized protein (DUF1684 family)